jgi:hypothetical protein
VNCSITNDSHGQPPALGWDGKFEDVLRTNYSGWEKVRGYLYRLAETDVKVWRRAWNKFLSDVRSELTRTFSAQILYPNNVGKPFVYDGNKPYISYPAVYYSGQDGPNKTLFNAIRNTGLAAFLFNKLRDPVQNIGWPATPWPNSEMRNTIFVDGSNALFEKKGCRNPNLPNSEGTPPAKPRYQQRNWNWNRRGSVFMVMKKDSFDFCVQRRDEDDKVLEYAPNFLEYLSSMTEDVDLEKDYNRRNKYNVVILVVDLRKCAEGYPRACLENTQQKNAIGEKTCKWKSNGVRPNERVDQTPSEHFWCEFDDNLLLYLFGQLLGYNNVVTVATADEILYEKSMVKDGHPLREQRNFNQQSVANDERIFMDHLAEVSIGLSFNMYKLHVRPA